MFQQNWLDELKHGNAVSDIQEIEKKKIQFYGSGWVMQ